MTRTTGRLTALKVDKAKRPGMYADGGGLYLQVTQGGASWIYRYMLAGRAREMGLGPRALFSLSAARAKALNARRLRHEGIDPIEIRHAERAKARLDAARAVTFNQCAESYIKAHRAGWRNEKHAAQWTSTLATYAGPVIGALPVQAIDTALVLKVLEPIWTTKPETASRLRGRIEAVLDWAKVRGYRAGENPARWRGHLDKLLPARGKVRKVEHHAALPYAELPAFMSELREHSSLIARALEFTILSATRTSETIGASWDEIDIEAKVWTIPGGRMKAGKEHRVPLCDRALGILRGLHRHGERIFPLTDDAAMLKLLRGMRPGQTVHGSRSSFRDWAAETTNFPNHVVEMALAHTIGDKVEKASRRSPAAT
jgi:integrase